MRLEIKLISEHPVILPASYSSYQQALIYNILDRFDAEWLHDRGFTFEKRNFKLFNFSGILERGLFRQKEKLFVFGNTVSFYISSPVDWILEQTASNLLKNEKVRLENNLLYIDSVAVLRKENIQNSKIKIKAISPIENHTTLLTADGRKKTYYYSPYEKEFSELTNKNLQKKWTALFQKECPYNIEIKPLFSGDFNLKHRNYEKNGKNTFITGWIGKYELIGEPDFIQFALDTGLGSRNSQGFGMITLQKQILVGSDQTIQTGTQQHNTVVDI
jgi:CRISPR-associated endoribonuclease Cas6